MFGSLGIPELLLIFVVALIVFGPRKLPEIGRTLGKALGEFKKATDELKNTIEREVRVEELKQIHPLVTYPPQPTVSRGEPVSAALPEPVTMAALEPAGTATGETPVASVPPPHEVVSPVRD